MVAGDFQPVSVTNEIHWLQNTYYPDRFQEYAPDWQQGQRHMPLIDLTKIEKVPISMIVATEDTFCTHETAMKTAETIGDNVVNFTSIEGADHAWFAWNNPDWFIDLVKSQLSDKTVKVESCNE